VFDRLSPWKTEPPQPAKPGADEIARRRLGLWVEFKRLHLGYAQALNAVTFGHSNTLALVKHAMLAEYEARRLCGRAGDGGPDLTEGEAMRQAVARCETAYRRINASAFDEKALAGVGDAADPHLIALMLNATTAPFAVADAAVIEAARKRKLETPERAGRFTPEITKLHRRLREHFTDLARRSGLA